MDENRLRKLESYGQSVWLDFIGRGMLASGDLEHLIEEYGVSGVTSNPSIFEKAIVESHDYDEAIHRLAAGGKTAAQIYEVLTVEDIRRTADLFRPLYDRIHGGDGFASIEVSPYLAHDTAGTVAEARRLWAELDRPNVFIKVPATEEGIPAIRQLITEGINVNITLLFGLPRYAAVADAYLSGLEARVAARQPVDRVASVASFFLSRIDVLLDPLLEGKAREAGAKAALARKLHGQVAIASAKVAYRMYKDTFGDERFHRLAAMGARTQRLLWASTSTKNPAYSDVKYVDALIGPETINTVPRKTLMAYADHGDPAPRLEQGIAEAEAALKRLPELGIALDAAALQLEKEGDEKFIRAYDQLLHTLEERRSTLVAGAR